MKSRKGLERVEVDCNDYRYINIIFTCAYLIANKTKKNNSTMTFVNQPIYNTGSILLASAESEGSKV